MMKKDKDFINQLNVMFKSKKFMEKLYADEENSLFMDNNYSYKKIYEKMGEVLEYYILTRDTNTSYSYEELSSKLKELNFDKYKDNVINNGFVTFSFNGNKKDLIDKYGLDYTGKLNDEERTELDDRRKDLRELENLLGKSGYLKDVSNSNNKELTFVCSPGAKTFYYACRNAPERLYEGPLKNYMGELASKEIPMIVGETKANYIMRVLESAIDDKCEMEESFDKKHAKEVAEKVVKEYCTSSPGIAMIDISKIKNVRYIL